MQVIVFQGGEYVTDQLITEITDWSEPSILAAMLEYKGEDESWLDQLVFDGPQTVRETFNIVNKAIAQIVYDEVDGG